LRAVGDGVADARSGEGVASRVDATNSPLGFRKAAFCARNSDI